MRDVWYELIRSCALPAYDMRFGTTDFQYMQPLAVHKLI
jgi:hypothetical protein